jgi:hypothetical protein
VVNGDTDYSGLFEAGFPLVEGRYDTPSLRFVPSINREVNIVVGGLSSYCDTQELLEAVLKAVEFADPGMALDVVAQWIRAGREESGEQP